MAGLLCTAVTVNTAYSAETDQCHLLTVPGHAIYLQVLACKSYNCIYAILGSTTGHTGHNLALLAILGVCHTGWLDDVVIDHDAATISLCPGTIYVISFEATPPSTLQLQVTASCKLAGICRCAYEPCHDLSSRCNATVYSILFQKH